jgi:membrane protease YdiL (CAAX protease family)
VTYLVAGLAGGTLLTNLWEEAAWTGFVRNRLMSRRGLLAGSVLTAVPFALIHGPGTFQNTPAAVAVFHVGVLAVLASFLRYVIGAVFIDTRGSILAVGLVHASFNATGVTVSGRRRMAAGPRAAGAGWCGRPARRLRRRSGTGRPTERPSPRPESNASNG